MFGLFIKHVASKCNLINDFRYVYEYAYACMSICFHICTLRLYLFMLFGARKLLFSCHKAGRKINESSSIPTWKRNKMMMKCDKIRWAAAEVRMKSRSKNV